MKTERILIITVFLSVILRFLWAYNGWPGELFTMYLVFISLLALLITYYLRTVESFYKLVHIYFMLYVIGISFNILEWKGDGMLLFLGTLGFIVFPVYLINRKRKDLTSNVFVWSLLLGLVLVFQCIMYLFINTDIMLTIGHGLSYPAILIASHIIFSRKIEKDINPDEKKILSFIIIANVLSVLGVTFKESFYILIWI
jgi:hypothetical protein